MFVYVVCQLPPPFGPDKYVKAISEAESAGYEVIIIDSLTHAWAGSGGLLEEVDKRKGKGNDFTAWRDVTPMHNALVDAMLQSSCHIIATMRTKTAYDMVKDEKSGKIKPVKVGLAPVQRDGMEYEFTVVMDLDIERHVATASKDRTGLFDNRYFVPTVDTGKELLAWLEDGTEGFKIETAIKAMMATQSMEALKEVWDRYLNDVKLIGKVTEFTAAKDQRKAELSVEA